ncbi:NitT/TauT family transport system substrate-binding protein [Maritalea mobilis]|uniref:Thiamine pyrimidine synthase n=1 Tax=Maritalea mobilis TaxID=483324 RepID=A0A4R6VRP1_9HYPH|nr:ABC transporter substrate-binding protein [Maritalea mobilis]TDQ66081.1 NitT/TauT family transport system substrate-binding protein [Maritalea mobilis]
MRMDSRNLGHKGRAFASTFGTIALAAAASLPASLMASSALAQDNVAISAEECERNQSVGTITYVSGYGYSASAGQLDVFLAKEFGFFDALCLDVEINAGGANGQLLVASGQAQFTALGSASDVMLAAANSRNLKAVATYGNNSPFSIFANEKIKSLKDLEGGTLGYFINITPIAKAMLDAAGVDMSKVSLIKMTNYDPTVVPRGQVDAIVGYASNQPEKLRSLGMPFNEFRPEDYGLQGTYNVMEVNSQFLEENREVAADFMRASLRALEYCLANEQDCVEQISALAAANNQGSAFPADQQARTWAVESSWVRNSNKAPGAHSPADWENEHAMVAKYGELAELPAIDEMMDADLVANLYKDGQLQWPR